MHIAHKVKNCNHSNIFESEYEVQCSVAVDKVLWATCQQELTDVPAFSLSTIINKTKNC